MTHEQLIKFAKQSAPDFTQYSEFFCTLHDFKRFAALVAAHEREACARVCMARYMGHNNSADMEALCCAAAIRARGKA